MRRSRFLKAVSALWLIAGLALWCGSLWGLAGQEKNLDQSVKNVVEHKLQKHKILMGSNIQVVVENMTITMAGTVQTLAQREQAIKDARSVGEGYKVVSELTVARANLTAEQIAVNVIAAVNKSVFYDIFDWVGLEVTNDGVTTVKGWVYVPFHRAEFIKIAESVPGVTKVVDQLKPEVPDDFDRALRIQAARVIYTTPMFQDFARTPGPIHILAENGVITLAGTVRSLAESENIENMIRSDTGALSVVNDLEVKEK